MSYSFIEKIVSVLLSLLKIFIDEKERERDNDVDREIIDQV
jgi:hypothetical protein